MAAPLHKRPAEAVRIDNDALGAMGHGADSVVLLQLLDRNFSGSFIGQELPGVLGAVGGVGPEILTQVTVPAV